jgi:hypothetical protein
MAKWVILAAGVFLFFNGMMSRVYGYTDPARHCFQKDYIYVYGCFGSSVMPHVITRGATLIGACLIIWSVIQGRRGRA